MVRPNFTCLRVKTGTLENVYVDVMFNDKFVVLESFNKTEW